MQPLDIPAPKPSVTIVVPITHHRKKNVQHGAKPATTAACETISKLSAKEGGKGTDTHAKFTPPMKKDQATTTAT